MAPRISARTEAHLLGLGSTLSSRPKCGFTPLHIEQGWACYHAARFRVAQSTARFRGSGRRMHFSIQRPASAAPARLGACGFGGLPQVLARLGQTDMCVRRDWQSLPLPTL